MYCLNCQSENLSDLPLCYKCKSQFQFKHRAGCRCDNCGGQLVEINDLIDVPTVAIIKRQSISRATRIIGNYAFFPDLGWRRYVTLASATWNQYLY